MPDCLHGMVGLLFSVKQRRLDGRTAHTLHPQPHHPHCTHHACMSHSTFLPLQVEGRGAARMDTLKVGDRVLTLAHNGSLAYE